MTAQRKPLILVIEDFEDSREMLKLILEGMDYRVLGAANGSEAIALATSYHVDLILTDFGLPDMDGNAVVRQLRGLNDRMRRIPIIMLTAFEGAEYYSAASRAGCTGFLTKPPDFERLQAMIESLLSEKGDDKEDTPNSVSRIITGQRYRTILMIARNYGVISN